MPQIRLFVTERLVLQGVITLNPDQSHYLLHVMRLKNGETLAVFNGQDGEFLAEITSATKKSVSLLILNQRKTQAAEPDIWLAFAPLKPTPMQFLAQKSTELGVSALFPVLTEHTAIRQVNTAKLHANAVEAAEQCERLTIPKTHALQPLSAFLEHFPPDRQLILCDESGQGAPLMQAIAHSPGPFALLIGPEGGFSPKELAILHKRPHLIAVGLGPRILRAETAALAALACIQAAKGDWHQAPHFIPE